MRRGGSTWATVGLIVLAVAALALAYAAVKSTQGTVTATSTTAASPTPGSLTPSSPTPSGSASARGTDDQGGDGGSLGDGLPDAVEPPLLLVSPALAYRASTGSCLGGAELERSLDGGTKWSRLDSPASAVLSLSSTGGDTVTVVGADAGCQVKVWTSTDQGESWSAPAAASDVFVRVPDDPSKLLTPTGTVKSPCPDRPTAPVSVDGISPTEAAVLCASGDVMVTEDGGVTWTTQSPVVGGAAMTFESPSLGWALRLNSGQCPSYQLMQTQDAALTWQTGGCLGVDPATARLGAGSLAYADPSLGIADLAGEVYRTQDSGLTWNRTR